MATEQKSVSREDLLETARDLIPVFKGRAQEAESLRQMPQATIDEIRASGLIRAMNPPRYGGHDDGDMDLYFDVDMELGRACGSTAWCYSVWASHNWMIGHWPLEAQEDYFAGGPDVLCSSAFAPLGRLQAVDGGYRLTGRWDFSSGSDGASWAMLGAIGPEGALYMALFGLGTLPAVMTTGMVTGWITRFARDRRLRVAVGLLLVLMALLTLWFDSQVIDHGAHANHG